jgi:3,5-epimerase/4-reductase
MNVLIFGANGWIGGMFINKWKELYPQDNIICSITRIQPQNEHMLKSEISKADRVICLTGRTSGRTDDGKWINTIDYLEQPGKLKENINDNLFSPLLLAILCNKLNVHLLYLGTGCIFSWNTNQDTSTQIKETDTPNFFGSSYSTVKGFTDTLLKQFENSVCNCRIRMPIVNFDHPRNFITKIVGYSKINNTNNSMTYLPEIIPIMIEMSKTKTVGTFNMTNPGYINHSTILNQYIQHVNPSHTFIIVKDENDLQLASKRSNNILDTTKLEEWCKEYSTSHPASNLKLSSIGHCITECFTNYKL